ncbi:aminotransferase class I/II-fold pyridoxal phosphate-dependent enzyme [Pseudoflavonifractor phocaeensis]|uniref:MalY/PatB family protein n=1 Tax=Pseudoflavonifractor phocaeensis TaxID=1870988 RepID=UPI00195B3A81|nr:aminotransferase class I/II-fold pyridoxal phosphate-dependent enzyme [Pseudoflavonifractor phocaeensis]MBM6939197.1 aminotransferase class I/II-fold pyridoxal phosphate-dependent enzyme [Pseudoflavonifractor phocaeensis]
MEFDFLSPLDRQGRDALAVDVIPIPGAQIRPGFSRLPMWVADMNFPTLPAIPEAIIRRASHPAYGYFLPSDDYYNAILRWHQTRNGVSGLERRHIGYENGVLGGLLSALQVLCAPGGKVLLHSPTYIGFTKSLERYGCSIVQSPLRQDGQGVWRMDYDDMEEKLKAHSIHAAILCSPHNPCGRVWTGEELERAMDLFRKYNVYVISDEIWSDLTLGTHRHIPTQSVSPDARQRTVALYAPSKTFNLAGLVGAYHIVYNDYLRERMEQCSARSHYNEMNVLSMHALIAAYSDAGGRWVDELRQVLGENVDYAVDFIRARFPGVTLAKPEGTYMLFLDCEEWCRQNSKSLDELLRAGVSVGVIWQDGRPFHGPWSIRMNLALPHPLVREAFDRLERYVFHPSVG